MASLTATQQRFVLHWGEMGTRWGISRTVAQIHALLYISDRPLNAEEISDSLSAARSNVSNSLRELQNWGIVRKIPVLGDKRDHYESLHDVWEMFRIILEERKKREVDPTLVLLEEVIREAEKSGEKEDLTVERLRNLREFFETTMNWYEAIQRIPRPALQELFRTGGNLAGLIGSAAASSDTSGSTQRRHARKADVQS
jgi:DNA-binding transcriptional regulator GbsR (MarR family)